jgi:serine/threonine protein kinase
MRALHLSTACSSPNNDNPGLRSEVRADAGTHWRPLELLGRGGTAEVFRAVDEAGREAALKRHRDELRAQPGMADRLSAEHRWLRSLGGEPFVATMGITAVDGTPTLVLEYLPGGDLVSLVGARAVHWLPPLRAVARALAMLHACGAAHGDLKARNVLFAADGTARLIDLASVGPLDAPAQRGTPAYRPAGCGVTGRQADAFAFAALAFELCFARLPFGRDGQAAQGQEPPAPAIAEEGVARLAETARRELSAGGIRGLSPLLDVIESVRAG